jgi:hypothetical protein
MSIVEVKKRVWGGSWLALYLRVWGGSWLALYLINVKFNETQVQVVISNG